MLIHKRPPINELKPFLAIPITGAKAAQRPLSELQTVRREEIIHAAWRMAASGGLAAVTIRSIAAEIGYTTGSVMHHFATKEAIVQEMIARLYQGLRDLYRAEGERATEERRLECMLLACLPLASKMAFGWRLTVVFQGECLRSPALSALHRQHYDVFEDDLRQELLRLRERKRLAAGTNLSHACARLLVLVEGIGTNHALRPTAMPRKLQRDLVRGELRLLVKPQKGSS